MAAVEQRTLVVGATGLLGMQIVRLLRAANRPVRAVVRETADRAKRAALEDLGVELVGGDLKDLASLEIACDGVGAVVSTANAMVSRQPGDSFRTVDEDGHRNLLAAAERSTARRFVFVSFPPETLDYELQNAKRAVECRLQSSRLSFTVLQPVNLMEAWLSPALGFDPRNGVVRIFGAGDRPVSWVSILDVARFAVAACTSDHMSGKMLPLGGPDALSQLQLVDMCKELRASPPRLEFVPESALEAQMQSPDPLAQAFAAVRLSTARGRVVHSGPQLQFLSGQLATARGHLSRLLGTTD